MTTSTRHQLGRTEGPGHRQRPHSARAVWSRELGGDTLVGFQASARSGVVGVELADDRVLVSCHAITVWDGALRFAPAT